MDALSNEGIEGLPPARAVPSAACPLLQSGMVGLESPTPGRGAPSRAPAGPAAFGQGCARA